MPLYCYKDLSRACISVYFHYLIYREKDLPDYFFLKHRTVRAVQWFLHEEILTRLELSSLENSWMVEGDSYKTE